MPVTVSALHIYPIKSVAPIELSAAHVQRDGLALDRRFVLTDGDGRFITARLAPELVRVQAALLPGGLALSAPGMPDTALYYAEFGPGRRPLTIWRDTLEARHCGGAADAWFSRYLGRPVHLLFQDATTRRRRRLGDHDGDVNFADGYPLLLTTEASLAEVNRRSREPIGMRRFRPNLVMRGDIAAFAEDGWRRIRLGSVEFDLVAPCSRCVFTTVDPAAARKSALNEPMETLKRFRSDGNKVYFGWHLVPRGTGLLRVGDRLEVLAAAEPARYGADTG
jgi:uncharacterized protein